MADQRSKHPRRPHRTGCVITKSFTGLPAAPLFPQETGTGDAAFLCDPTREKAILENPQIFQNCKLKIIFPLFMRKANAARIPNRPYSKKAAAQSTVQRPFCALWEPLYKKEANCDKSVKDKNL